MEITEELVFKSEDKELLIIKNNNVFEINIDDNFNASEVQTIINILTEIIK